MAVLPSSPPSQLRSTPPSQIPDNSEGGIAARKKALRAAAADTAGADRARAKQGQDALLERINQITLEALTSKGGSGERERGGEREEFFFF